MIFARGRRRWGSTRALTPEMRRLEDGARERATKAFWLSRANRCGAEGRTGSRAARETRSNTPIDARTFDSCIAPMCATEVCAQGGRGIARSFCDEACGSRARFGSRFGESWSTSALNPVNFNAMLGALTTSYPGAASLVQSFVRVQTTIFLMRTIYNAVMSSLGEASSCSAAPSFSASPSFSPPRRRHRRYTSRRLSLTLAVIRITTDDALALVITTDDGVWGRRRYMLGIVRALHLPRFNERQSDMLLRRDVL